MTSNVFNIQNLPKSLTTEENIELFRLKQNGDMEARKKLIIGNIYSVFYRVNNKFSTVEYDKNDLISIGIIGLIKAVDSFNFSKGNKFITYLIKCIDNEILMFLRKLSKDSKNQSFEQSVYKDKDDNEMSLVNLIKDDNDFTLDYIENDYINECCKLIKNYISKLPKKEQEIIILYYGLNNKRYTQYEIANKIGISQSYVNRILKKIIKNIQTEINKMQNINYNNLQKENKITIDTMKKAFELLKSPIYSQMMSTLTVKEAIIISLQLGYIDRKIFSVSAISNFFNISDNEVIEITRKSLLKYRENIKLFLNEIDSINKKEVLKTY